MTEAIISPNYLSAPGSEPFIGDLGASEELYNVTDGRLWVGDESSTPIEIGGNCKNRPIGPAAFTCYASVDITNPDNLPISNSNPNSIPAGFYSEIRMLINFADEPLTGFSAYFDYEIDWGDELTWKELGAASTPLADNPIDYYSARGRKILIELCSYGPSQAWIGRVIWVNALLD